MTLRSGSYVHLKYDSVQRVVFLDNEISMFIRQHFARAR
jgi:hypothetical protein